VSNGFRARWQVGETDLQRTASVKSTHYCTAAAMAGSPQITDITWQLTCAANVTVSPLWSGDACAVERVQDCSNLYMGPYATPCRGNELAPPHGNTPAVFCLFQND
jgi:hypothetical protein